MRCFISVNLSPEIKKEIEKIQNKLPIFEGKKTELENLHLTLKFLGEIEEEKLEEIKTRLKEIKFKKFNSTIKNLGFFDNRKSKNYSKKIIVWLYLSNCVKLQSFIDDKLLNLFKKEKRFMSHLTIARIKKLDNKKKFLEVLNKIKIPKIKFKIDCFYLMESKLTSKGPKYEVIKEYNLI